MRQDLISTHLVDGDGNPSGGTASAVGLYITWQDGPLGRGEERKKPNGAFVETVICAALGRIQWYQEDQRFRCRENALAITKLEEALHWLEARTARREAAGTEGTHEAD